MRFIRFRRSYQLKLELRVRGAKAFRAWRLKRGKKDLGHFQLKRRFDKTIYAWTPSGFSGRKRLPKRTLMVLL